MVETPAQASGDNPQQGNPAPEGQPPQSRINYDKFDMARYGGPLGPETPPAAPQDEQAELINLVPEKFRRGSTKENLEALIKWGSEAEKAYSRAANEVSQLRQQQLLSPAALPQAPVYRPPVQPQPPQNQGATVNPEPVNLQELILDDPGQFVRLMDERVSAAVNTRLNTYHAQAEQRSKVEAAVNQFFAQNPDISDETDRTLFAVFSQQVQTENPELPLRGDISGILDSAAKKLRAYQGNMVERRKAEAQRSEALVKLGHVEGGSPSPGAPPGPQDPNRGLSVIDYVKARQAISDATRGQSRYEGT